MANILYTADESIPATIAKALEQVRVAIRTTKPGHVLRCPNFHVWEYRGVRCEALQCLVLNTIWVGYVRLPAGTTYEWSADDDRPFICGVDFHFRDGDDLLVGFHADHTLDGNLLVKEIEPRSVDYVAEHLRRFLDTAIIRTAAAPGKSERTASKPKKRKL